MVIACSGNGCAAKSTTGQIRVKDHRTWLKTQGWGRGSDPGQAARIALPERTESRSMTRGGVRFDFTVKLKPRPAREGRPSTKSKDLCPACLAVDRAAAVARADARQKQVAARDAGRITRAAGKAA
jgi:hypothetical protein